MTLKLGWCLDKRHNECPHHTFIMRDPEYRDSIIGLTCDCTCHDETKGDNNHE